MQKIAAYLIERYDGMDWFEARAAEVERLKSEVWTWLQSKGVKALSSAGDYKAQDKSEATFSIEEASDGIRTWWFVRLQEVTRSSGRKFIAAISITNAGNKVAVYATLEVGSDATFVNPVEVEAKCPRIIRSMLSNVDGWRHGFTEIRGLRRIEGFEAGQGLAAELKHPERTVPFIVISEIDRLVVLPGLEGDLSRDLVGIANVVLIDSDAAWALTDYLGSRLSCFSGAVRLYWPRLSLSEDPYRHPLWTGARLRSSSEELRQRFSSQLRKMVMSASALSVVRPREIDDIRSAANRQAFAELKERARALHDHAELADLYEKDNDQLRGINADLEARIEELQTRVDELQVLVTKLDGDGIALRAHLQAAKKKLPSIGAEDIAPEATIDVDQDFTEPSNGEERFYKKRFAAPDHDVMVRVNDCGHNRWQPAHHADKARKGVAKAENGRSDWKAMQHCSMCTGGGMWRVRW